jgi:hypothetical protein
MKMQHAFFEVGTEFLYITDMTFMLHGVNVTFHLY